MRIGHNRKRETFRPGITMDRATWDKLVELAEELTEQAGREISASALIREAVRKMLKEAGKL
jgi:hypothetical protein